MNQNNSREQFLHLLHQVGQHTPLKIEETAGTDYDRGYIFYQDMVLPDVKELETTMWEWHHQELQKVIDELSQERTGFLDHIAKLEKTHQEELQKARLSIAERVRQGRFSKVANDSWNDDNTFGYKEALKDVAEWLENQSELDQLTSDNK